MVSLFGLAGNSGYSDNQLTNKKPHSLILSGCGGGRLFIVEIQTIDKVFERSTAQDLPRSGVDRAFVSRILRGIVLSKCFKYFPSRLSCILWMNNKLR